LTKDAENLQRGLPLTRKQEANDELGQLVTALENAAAILAEQRETIGVSLEGAQILIWELYIPSDTILYRVGSQALKKSNSSQGRSRRPKARKCESMWKSAREFSRAAISNS